MNNTEQRYLELNRRIKMAFIASDDAKILGSSDLFEMQNLFNNLATGSALANQYTSFKDYLLQELGRNMARVMQPLRIGKYMIKYNIPHENFFGIQLPKLELVAKHDKPFNDDVLDMLLVHDYKTLEIILKNEEEEES